MGLRYGLLAALTLILASGLVWDRLHPAREARLDPREEPAREDLAVVVVGGTPVPLAPPPPPAASMPGAVLPADAGPDAAQEAPRDEYTVEKGDTLGGIAQRTLGTTRRAAELARCNGIALDTPLQVGQVLRMPSSPPAPPPPGPAAAATRDAAGIEAESGRGLRLKSGAVPRILLPEAAPGPPGSARVPGRTHRVVTGDSLFSLARRYYGDGTKFGEIARANGIDPEETLRPGRELLIP